MMTQRILAIVLLIPFTLLSLYAVLDVGYMGIFEHALENSAGWQLLADLAISLILVFSWLIPEALRAGRNPWPWLILTLMIGSFAPLLYLTLYGGQEPAKMVSNN